MLMALDSSTRFTAVRGGRPVRRHLVLTRVACAVLVLLIVAGPTAAQDVAVDVAQTPEEPATNPMAMLQSATDAVPGFEGGMSATLNVVILLTVLSLAPAILILCTSFTRIVVVLALLRHALGTQTLPPSQVIIGLSLFMTFLVMAPTFNRVHDEALAPLSAGEVDQMAAWAHAKQPLRDFMFDQIERTDNWGDVYMVMNYRGIDTAQPEQLRREHVDMLTLVPAFVLSELKTAFLIGFRIYLPFLIIDMVVASLLISMGMLMLPPVLISLPFKLLLFVMVDGWQLVVGNLLDSFSLSGVG